MNGQYQVYKSTGAVQVRLIPYKDYKNGAIYLEATKSTGKGSNGLPNYDWDSKIKFAMGPNDIATLFEAIDKGKSNFKLIHKINGKEGEGKVLTFTAGQGQYKGSWMLSFVDRDNDNSCTVPMSAGEWRIFLEIIRQSLLTIVGWAATLQP